jgi:hypothetical protein
MKQRTRIWGVVAVLCGILLLCVLVKKSDLQAQKVAQAQQTDSRAQQTDSRAQQTDSHANKTDSQMRKVAQAQQTDSRANKTDSRAQKSEGSKHSVKPDLQGFVDSRTLPTNKESEHCAVCKSGVPCEYPNEVDLRIIVLGFNRENSLQKCLDRIPKLVLDGAKIAVDIWLDVTPAYNAHYPTYLVAQNFSSSWKQGEACVHIQTNHSHVDKQWLLSWRPQENSKEMALIIEDDVDISPYAVRWLLAANKTFFDDSSVYSYTLKSEMVCGQHTPACAPIPVPKTHPAFKFPLFGNWGFSPKGSFWRQFQDWYTETLRKTPSYRPYVEGLHRYNDWYERFLKEGTARTMVHEMFILHYVFGHREKIYCLYHNLQAVTGNTGAKLSTHRQESGMHYKGQGKKSEQLHLVTDWDPTYANFSRHDCPTYDTFGNLVPNFEQT